jgi:hypothetical protein
MIAPLKEITGKIFKLYILQQICYNKFKQVKEFLN